MRFGVNRIATFPIATVVAPIVHTGRAPPFPDNTPVRFRGANLHGHSGVSRRVLVIQAPKDGYGECGADFERFRPLGRPRSAWPAQSPPDAQASGFGGRLPVIMQPRRLMGTSRNVADRLASSACPAGRGPRLPPDRLETGCPRQELTQRRGNSGGRRVRVPWRAPREVWSRRGRKAVGG